ncbi:MAG: NUDIX hydrolase [Bacilli bacterium]|nr:NUDIX hydrolase [Bacilli bacterium]
MNLIEKKVSSKEVYRKPFLTIHEDEVMLPNDTLASRVYVKHIGAAAVLAITKDHKIILTRQYRYPISDISLEIPAGKKDALDELGIDCVTRELEEETGYTSGRMEHLFDFFTCVGYSDEKIELFVAYDCVLKEDRLLPDEDEFIEVELFDLDAVKTMLANGTIKDAKTILAIQSYLLKR